MPFALSTFSDQDLWVLSHKTGSSYWLRKCILKHAIVPACKTISMEVIMNMVIPFAQIPFSR